MSPLKKIFKMILALCVGAIGGFLGLGVCIVMFTDTTFTEFFSTFKSVPLLEMAGAALAGIVAFVVSQLFLIFIHELGHLVAGLLSGYKFVSFRVLNYTFIRIDGKTKVKKYSVAGTAGQCLLTPPERDNDRISATWYNAGGIIANLVCLFAALPLLWLPLSPLAAEITVIFILTDIILLVMNGIPMKIGGLGNDAYNIRLLRKSPLSKSGFLNQLRANALIQNGVRPKDMPDSLFPVPDFLDYSNTLEVTIPIMHASRLVDCMDYQNAIAEFENLYSRKEEIVKIYVNEIASELVYLYLATGQPGKARDIFDDNLRKITDTASRFMSSKKRLLCAVALCLDNDRTQAEHIYADLLTAKDSYLLQGEVKSDLALMEMLLNNNRNS